MCRHRRYDARYDAGMPSVHLVCNSHLVCEILAVFCSMSRQAHLQPPPHMLRPSLVWAVPCGQARSGLIAMWHLHCNLQGDNLSVASIPTPH